MGFDKPLDSVGILWEARKLFFRNEKLMSSITQLIIFLNSILLVLNFLSIKAPISDLAFKPGFLQVWSPANAEFTNLIHTMKKDLRSFVGLEWTFIFMSYFTSLFFTIASILASAVAYFGKNLSTLELLSRAVQSFKRSFATCFYITLLDLGYSLFIAFLLPLALFFDSIFTVYAFFITIFKVALVFRSYLAVYWKIALVVSVLEEKCGIEALGKAGQLINGSKQRGFLVNLSGLFSICVFYGLQIIGTIAFPHAAMIPMLLVNSIFCHINMLLVMAYTILYYECKEIHGEKLEMQGSTGYTKVTIPYISVQMQYDEGIL